jgi:DNA-binding response OmpR family regulator
MTEPRDLQTVLVVDDEPEIRGLLSEYFKSQGFEVIEAENGFDALLQVKRTRPDAVVLDLMMPRLGGLDALKRIRAFDLKTKVIVITGVRDQELQRQAISLGAAAFFTKPLDLQELLTAVISSTVRSEQPHAPELSSTHSPPIPLTDVPLSSILVVDDEPEICQLLEEYFTGKGYRVRIAMDGATAVRAVLESAPDVILLDINMPGLGGLEALAAIRAIAPDVQVIMVSGQCDLDRAEQSLAYGAFDYITKPFGLPYLTESVETALSMRGLDD